MPFRNQLERDLHFAKHGHNFQAADAVEYKRMADAFMFGPMTIAMSECARANATDRLRYNIANRNFGVANVVPAFLKTFYLVPMHTLARHGGSQNYFAYECGRAGI